MYQQALLSLWGFVISAMLVTKLVSRPGRAEARPGLLRRPANWRQNEEEIRRTEVLINRIRNAEPRRHSKLVYALGAAAMAGLGVYCGWNTGGDYVLDHEVVVGRVEGARYLSHTRSPGAYQLLIDHRAYDIPATSPRKWDVGITSKSMLASHRGRSWRSGATFIRPGATCHSRRTMGRVRFAGNFTEGEECPFCHTRLERAS